MVNNNPKYYWGNPNKNWAPPSRGNDKLDGSVGTLSRVRGDFPEPDEDQRLAQELDRAYEMYDRAPGQAPVLPTGEYSPMVSAAFSIQAMKSVSERSKTPLDQLPHSATGTDGGHIIREQLDDGSNRIAGYGTLNADGNLHSYDDNPALLRPNGAVEWHRNGRVHRIGGPAIMHQDPETGEIVSRYYHHGVEIDSHYADNPEAIDPEEVSEERVDACYDDYLKEAGLSR